MPTNRYRTTAVAAILGAVALGSTTARADERPWKNVADFGLVNAAGNTDVTTLNAADTLTYTAAPWRAGGLFSVIYGETDGETTASSWRLGGRVERDLTPRLSLYGLVGWDKDRFAGIDRRFEESAGLAFRVVDQNPNHVVLDAGVGFYQQRNTLDVSDEFVAARLAALYQYDLAEKAYFRQTVEVLPSFETSEDVRVNSDTSLVVPVWKAFAVKVSYVVRYDRLPEPGFETTDRTFTTGVQYTY
jgi:putative salt-induced outer membrane protein